MATVFAEVAGQGYALVLQELEQGPRSIAVPVRDGSGAVVATLNVSDSARRGTPEAMLRDLLPPLQATACQIEADLQRG